MFDKTTASVLTAVTGLSESDLNSQFYVAVEGKENEFNPIEEFEPKLAKLVTDSITSKTTTASNEAVTKAQAEWKKNQPQSYKAALKELALKQGVKIESDDFETEKVFGQITGKISEAAVAKALEDAKKKEVTEDDVKRHPFFTNFEKTLRDTHSKEVEDWKGKFENVNGEYQTYKQQIETEKRNAAVKGAYNGVISSMNPTVQAGEENLLLNRKNAALRDIQDKYDIGIGEDEKPILYEKGSGKDGKTPVVARDKNQNPLKFDAVAKEAFRVYHNSFASSSDNGGKPKGSGSKNEKGGDEGKPNSSNSDIENLVIEAYGKLPSSRKEYNDFLGKEVDFKYRNALSKYFNLNRASLS